MNLKVAARQLGVHYQTAYRWVRSGELAAVRVGRTYDISEAAVVRLRRQRELLLNESSAHATAAAPRPLQDSAERLRSDVDRLAHACVAGVGPLLVRVVQGLAELTGMGCAVRLVEPDGAALVPFAWWHPDIGRLGVWTTLLGASAVRIDDPTVRSVFAADGAATVVDHLPQDIVRQVIDREVHYLLDLVPWCGLARMPLRGRDDEPRGMLVLLNDVPGHVFDRDHIVLAEDLARTASGAFARSEAFVAATAEKRAVVDRLHSAARTLTDDALLALGGDLVREASNPAVLVDCAGRALAGNGPWAASAREELVRAACYPTVEHNNHSDHAAFEQLWSGALDHLSLHLGHETATGTAHLDVHWGAVRRPDASTVALVATSHVRHIASATRAHDTRLSETDIMTAYDGVPGGPFS